MTTARTVVVGLVLLLVCAGNAFGQNAGPGSYAGVRVGSSTLDTPIRNRDGGGLPAYDRDTITWAVFGGHEWPVGRHLLVGGEVGYSDNGAATLTYVVPETFEFTSRQFDVLGSMTVVRRRLAVGVKAGVGVTREQYRLTGAGGATPALISERTRNLPVVALTFGYGLGKRVAFCMDFRRTFGDVASTLNAAFTNPTPAPARTGEVLNSVSRVTGLSAGLRVRF
jgi:hypothetical protein